MGYCMSHVDSSFYVPKNKKAAALKAIKGLAGKETIKDCSGPHFSWVNTEEFLRAKTLEAGVEAWRWYLVGDEDGDVEGIGFNGEKLGDDAVLFQAIAPFVKKGSFIEMQGEDGALWRWTFDGKKMIEKAAKISWD